MDAKRSTACPTRTVNLNQGQPNAPVLKTAKMFVNYCNTHLCYSLTKLYFSGTWFTMWKWRLQSGKWKPILSVIRTNWLKSIKKRLWRKRQRQCNVSHQSTGKALSGECLQVRWRLCGGRRQCSAVHLPVQLLQQHWPQHWPADVRQWRSNVQWVHLSGRDVPQTAGDWAGGEHILRKVPQHSLWRGASSGGWDHAQRVQLLGGVMSWEQLLPSRTDLCQMLPRARSRWKLLRFSLWVW